MLAGAVAFIALTFGGGYISDNALGYSEGLATMVILIAVDRHLDGAPRQAFAVGFLAALDRPEIWLFWGPYGLWLFWRDPGARKLVIGLFLLIPILWFAARVLGLGALPARGQPRPEAARQQPRLCQVPVLRGAHRPRVADDAAADQGRRSCWPPERSCSCSRACCACAATALAETCAATAS